MQNAERERRGERQEEGAKEEGQQSARREYQGRENACRGNHRPQTRLRRPSPYGKNSSHAYEIQIHTNTHTNALTSHGARRQRPRRQTAAARLPCVAGQPSHPSHWSRSELAAHHRRLQDTTSLARSLSAGLTAEPGIPHPIQVPGEDVAAAAAAAAVVAAAVAGCAAAVAAAAPHGKQARAPEAAVLVAAQRSSAAAPCAVRTGRRRQRPWVVAQQQYQCHSRAAARCPSSGPGHRAKRVARCGESTA